MEGRKWEEMDTDCLENVFGRVGMESLLLDVPLVCKSWYKATLSPICWQSLVFPRMSPNDSFTCRLMKEYEVDGEEHLPNVTSFIKFVVNRSCQSATTIVLPTYCLIRDALEYVAEKCPNLRTLMVPVELTLDVPCHDLPFAHFYKILNLVNKWKKLEHLSLGFCSRLKELVAEISVHCKNFEALAVEEPMIRKDDASAIANLLPNIKYLDLRKAIIERDNLVNILQGCIQLVHFDVSDCYGFDGDDDEILKLASHIRKFKCRGSVTFNI